jgi:glycosyltransferase involved in cell wall biosynthesis
MRTLVLHQNFPGQFGHLVHAWRQRPGWQVRALGRDTAPGLPGFDALQRYQLARAPHAKQHPYLRTMESAVLHGQAVARALLEMKKTGFTPDVVLAHPGWGESLYVKDVFPDTRLVHFCEWWYATPDADVGFDPEFPTSFDARARNRTLNALHALNLSQSDAAITPTHWQHSRHPKVLQPHISVHHEGIATASLGPNPQAVLTTPNGTTLKAGDPLITYVARNLEPYRGIHTFLRMLEQVQRRHPQVHALIVGGNGVSYGSRPKDAPNWREHLLKEVKLDPQRTHFVGKLPRHQYLRVLQTSAVHCYFTYPFVLSWSLLEAMACGALIVGSDTAPVREVVRHGHNGLLGGFFDVPRLAELVLEALAPTERHRQMRANARRTAMGYSHEAGIEGYERVVFGAGSAEDSHPTLKAAKTQEASCTT